jgi:kynurenine formamidase
MKIVDLSAPIQASPEDTPELLRTVIEYVDHRQGAAEIEERFGVPSKLLRNGEGWARENFARFGTHNSTHVDAPYHYNSVVQGAPAATIDELPLELFFAPGLVVDFSAKGDGDAITRDEIEAAIITTGHDLMPRDIVLVRTDRDRFYDLPDYMVRGPGVTAEATKWLFDCGVRVMAIDAWGWDRPLDLQAQEALACDLPGIFWAAHQCDLPYSQIERLFNLSSLPAAGFMVACFPLRLVGASAAPARVVAILGE